MADKTKIEWTDATWNIVTGCGVVSPGCANCYAMRLAGTRLKNIPSRRGLTREVNGNHVWTGEVRVNWEWIDQPLQWSKACKIFVAAHGDLFHAKMATDDIATIFGVMVAAHHLRGHVFQVLTKRSDRMRAVLSDPDFWEQVNAHAEAEIMERVDPLARRRDDARATCEEYGPDNPPPGIWLGASVEDQQRADERLEDLRHTPAAIRFISFEPLLGAIFAENWFATGAFHWAIAGGESGPGARPMHPAWARSLAQQCRASGTAFFMKQLSVDGKLRKEMEYFPADLQIREFPDAP